MLKDPKVRDEIALIRDYYEKGFPSQFDRGGYPTRPAFNVHSGKLMDALNGLAVLFIDRSLNDLCPQDIRDDPFFFDMRKVGSVVISDFVNTASMSLIGSDAAPFHLRLKHSLPLANGHFGNLIPEKHNIIFNNPQDKNQGDSSEFKL